MTLTLQSSSESSDEYRLGRAYLPLNASGERYGTYHEAVSAFDRPENWFNATCYRVCRVEKDPSSGERTLTFVPGTYWEGFDATETLSHEAAHVYLKTSGRRIDGRLRRRLFDPLDLLHRPRPVGFGTLTIRRSADSATFFLHRRDERVAMGQNRTTVVPSGEFQPSDDSRYSLVHDLNLWNAIMREYAEEFLGMDEARLRLGAPIDHVHSSPFVELDGGKESGSIRVFVLSMGVDALNWKFNFHTVCVFEEETFDSIFAEMISRNEEGMFELPTLHRSRSTPFHGWPFDAETVQSYLSADPHIAASLQTLALAWKHRQVLGLEFS